jgi:5-methyltetrahydrofolate--homocysteine methyltransferase
MSTKPNRIERLQQLLRDRLVILDGAMGTMIQQHKLAEADYRGERFGNWHKDVKGLNDLPNVTRISLVKKFTQYLEAGADIIETNTFTSQSISLADYGLNRRLGELAKAGAQCAPLGRCLPKG